MDEKPHQAFKLLVSLLLKIGLHRSLAPLELGYHLSIPIRISLCCTGSGTYL